MKWLKVAAFLAVALAIGQAKAAGIPANILQYSPANPATTTSTTPVMMGVGFTGEFTPHYDGVALITISGTANDNTISAGGQFQIQYGTGTAPANAATFTGTACGNVAVAANGSLASNVANKFSWTVTCIATGMVLNTPYWIDVAYSVTAASTLTVTNVNVSAAEL